MTRKRLIFAVCLATLGAFAVFSSNGIAARGPVSISDLAPADEYFGHMRLSPLGVRHMIFSLKDQLHHGRRKPDAIEHDALEVQDALQDWSTRYPHDSWIPAALWNLAVLYEELPGDDARTHALAVLEKIRDQYAGTDFANDARRDLNRGIGVRPWPRWAGSPPPSSSPSPSASSSLSSSPSSSPTPSPSSSPVIDELSLLRAITAAKTMDVPQALELESKFWSLSHDGTDAAYARCAWELAAAFEALRGQTAQTQAIRLLALLVDRYPDDIYGKWAMRDLKRGVGLRP
jgi:hypothetical protein